MLRLPALCSPLLAALGACAAAQRDAVAIRPLPMDLHSQCEPNRVRVRHLALDFTVDFQKKEVRGVAELAFDRIDPAAPLTLDTQDLVIESVMVGGAPRAFRLGDADKNLGARLTIDLAPADLAVTIRYRTTEKSGALQWLAPEQTAGGKYPFVFTQGQSIFTRSWIPMQDSPGVRITFDAKGRVDAGDPALAERLTVVMAAQQLGRGSDRTFQFRLDKPIPPYLLAMACGDLESRAVSERCAIWAEPSVVQGARDELSDTEAMIQIAEKLYGPYRWGRYDLLILPPAFPFGGMENPCLTFATPTILAGDKSLVSLVAHELAHSWSGNLVTNATWSDFWLNEGFTVYLETRIMEAVFGASRSEMEKQLARADLEKEMSELEPRDQVLHLDLHGRHPDDGFTTVPYEKGALFLRRLEQIFGREAFDAFLKRYFSEHQFRSLSTLEFVAYLKANLLDGDPKRAAQIDVDAWLEKPGLPADAPRAVSDELGKVDAALAAWRGGADLHALPTNAWTTQHWVHFVENLPADFAASRMAELDRAFAFTKNGNSEIACSWLRRSIEFGYAAADARLRTFLLGVGRRKFLKPLYAELVKTAHGRARARAIYAEARPRYHPMVTATLDKIVN